MPAAVYSTAFFAENAFTGSAVYTVPAGKTAYIRNIDVVWIEGLSSAEFQIHGTAGQNFFVATFDPISDHSDSWRQWFGQHIVAEGDSFSIHADSALDISVSGYLLTN